jgi:hypothetical protein
MLIIHLLNINTLRETARRVPAFIFLSPRFRAIAVPFSMP